MNKEFLFDKSYLFCLHLGTENVTIRTQGTHTKEFYDVLTTSPLPTGLYPLPAVNAEKDAGICLDLNKIIRFQVERVLDPKEVIVIEPSGKRTK